MAVLPTRGPCDRVWLGHLTLATVLDDGRLKLDGSRREIEAFRRWFCLSHFAAEGRRLAAV